jgi:hypothetical protein
MSEVQHVQHDETQRPVRRELPPMPKAIAALPLDPRGYPIPWFVAMVNGVADFRVINPQKVVDAVRNKRCWVCGGAMWTGKGTFVIGPMCAVNHVSAEPPSHYECAEWSARACPFLSRPHMTRRGNDDIRDVTEPIGGVSIARNPGVTILWTSRSYRAIRVGATQPPLFRIGDAVQIRCYTQARPATPAEVRAAFDGGLPILEAEASREGPDAARELVKLVRDAEGVLGIRHVASAPSAASVEHANRLAQTVHEHVV